MISGVTRLVVTGLALLLLVLSTGCPRADGNMHPEGESIEVPSGTELAQAVGALEKQVADVEGRNRKLLAKVYRFAPKGVYIVVDTGTNRLYLMDGEKILREATVSTGSGSRLADVHGKRVWIFNTPRGEFEVQRKIVDPVWTKPDWAFIEDGEPIPKNYSERMDPYVLGDYALAIGDGYLIHGSLYKRTLGMSVTHGCIRVGDDDLEVVFKAAQIGTKVYII
jgi:lipoprotein-anchoring transpeptidase ErfK/SrfK